jgi:hypothetical protein
VGRRQRFRALDRTPAAIAVGRWDLLVFGIPCVRVSAPALREFSEGPQNLASLSQQPCSLCGRPVRVGRTAASLMGPSGCTGPYVKPRTWRHKRIAGPRTAALNGLGPAHRFCGVDRRRRDPGKAKMLKWRQSATSPHPAQSRLFQQHRRSPVVLLRVSDAGVEGHAAEHRNLLAAVISAAHSIGAGDQMDAERFTAEVRS